MDTRKAGCSVPTTLSFGLVDLAVLVESSNTDSSSADCLGQIRVQDKGLALCLSPEYDAVLLKREETVRNRFAVAQHNFVFLTPTSLLISSKAQDQTTAADFEKALRLGQMDQTKRATDQKSVDEPSSKRTKLTEFDSRTENESAEVYFQFYGFLHQQQNMLQDFVRTSTYQRAFLSNCADFKDRVVLDVGAGTGILSFFALQAGARRVYAVEASSMAQHCQELVRTNNLSDKVIVLPGKVEEVSVPEPVDVIVSEPMGYMLVNERMLESYVHARKFLKPGGRMFPTSSNLYLSFFSDELLYQEQVQKVQFWLQDCFYGVNLTGLRTQANAEVFKQPIVDNWTSNILCSEVLTWPFDFEKDPVEKLQTMDIPLSLRVQRTCFLHGLASWFDVSFVGKQETVLLSTGPNDPLTHWYQVRCLFAEPLFVREGDIVEGRALLQANDRLSYDIELEVEVNGQVRRNQLDLKNPHFRYNNTAALIVQSSGQQQAADGAAEPSSAAPLGTEPSSAQLLNSAGHQAHPASSNGSIHNNHQHHQHQYQQQHGNSHTRQDGTERRLTEHQPVTSDPYLSMGIDFDNHNPHRTSDPQQRTHQPQLQQANGNGAPKRKATLCE